MIGDSELDWWSDTSVETIRYVAGELLMVVGCPVVWSLEVTLHPETGMVDGFWVRAEADTSDGYWWAKMNVHTGSLVGTMGVSGIRTQAIRVLHWLDYYAPTVVGQVIDPFVRRLADDWVLNRVGTQFDDSGRPVWRVWCRRAGGSLSFQFWVEDHRLVVDLPPHLVGLGAGLLGRFHLVPPAPVEGERVLDTWVGWW